MQGLKNVLLAEQDRLEQIVAIAKRRLERAPAGSLHLSNWKGTPQYYHYTEDKKETYIRKGNEAFIQKLAQKPYDEEVLKVAERRLAQLEKISKDYSDDEIEKIFYKQHLQRQKFIQPVELTWEQRIAEWIAEDYTGKQFADETPVILTERGERVRSKSEKILADYFARKGIHYKYECPLYLKGMGTIYPDFTFLSKKTGREIYWEHNGKMDDPIYARNAIRKIKAYEKNGIFQGEQLILTYETEHDVLSTKEIEMMIERYLSDTSIRNLS